MSPNLPLSVFLSKTARKTPRWLDTFSPGDKVSIRRFLASGVVYYPGSGLDGHAIKVFGSSHSAHCFVQADYGVSEQELKTALSTLDRSFRGYRSLAHIPLKKSEVFPKDWTPHLPDLLREASRKEALYDFFAFLEIFERESHYDTSHGPSRIAVLFLGADGIDCYDRLFCQANSKAPLAIVIEDHGLGGNYDRFGKDGLMEYIAQQCQAYPRWLLVAANSDSWSGYKQVDGVDADQGGMHGNMRSIFQHLRETW